MSQILEKHLLLIAGLFIMMEASNSELLVAAFLLSVVFLELTFVVKERKYKLLLLGIYLLACLIYWPFVAMLPVAFYEIAGERKYSFFSSGLILLCMYKEVEHSLFVALLFLLLLAACLGYENYYRRRNYKERIEAYDTAKDMENRLKVKNKELMESQDENIHLAMLKERNRIAREIHDNVGHMLSRTILQMGALQTIHSEEPLHSQLENISATLNEAMNNIRESVHDLHDESLDLKQAIYEATKDMKKTYLLNIDYDMSPVVDRKVKYCFLSIVKEAMANVVKHSTGNKVSILLREHPGFYQLFIEDNGTVTEGTDDKGIGLSNMSDRVEALGGNFQIDRENGFRIRITVPKEKKE